MRRMNAVANLLNWRLRLSSCRESVLNTLFSREGRLANSVLDRSSAQSKVVRFSIESSRCLRSKLQVESDLSFGSVHSH